MEKYKLSIIVSENAYNPNSHLDYEITCLFKETEQKINLNSRMNHLPLNLKEIMDNLRRWYEPDEVSLSAKYSIYCLKKIWIDCSGMLKTKRYIIWSESIWEIVHIESLNCPIVPNSNMILKNISTNEIRFIQNNTIKGLTLYNVKLNNGTMFNNIIEDANFIGVDFWNLILSSVTFRKALFQECDLTCITLNNIQWPDTYKVTSTNWSIANKEIYRQIKHVYDSTWNKTEANKFFAKEMEYYEKSLTWKEWDKKLISFIQRVSNNYSISWLKPTWWMLFIIILASIYKYHYWIDMQRGISNMILSNILPISEIWDFKSFLDLGYKLTWAFLVYQFVVALRRISQR